MTAVSTSVGDFVLIDDELAVDFGDGRVIVSFEWPYPCSSVELRGSFNGWSPRGYRLHKESNLWVTRLSLLPGTYTYKFFVDGFRWCYDTKLPTVKDARGNVNNQVVVVPRPKQPIKKVQPSLEPVPQSVKEVSKKEVEQGATPHHAHPGGGGKKEKQSKAERKAKKQQPSSDTIPSPTAATDTTHVTLNRADDTITAPSVATSSVDTKSETPEKHPVHVEQVDRKHHTATQQQDAEAHHQTQYETKEVEQHPQHHYHQTQHYQQNYTYQSYRGGSQRYQSMRGGRGQYQSRGGGGGGVHRGKTDQSPSILPLVNTK
eukprot:TRINITY_DN1645_c0_g1_i2.p1 TRINITY_DN1645_c0_g1~~TRINITY_DN1645_c0_g1_i2.p1  ORF type:complete len:317 (+),score=74.01 TRINITY_DN1645_c0_g1_i2:46-996(+)